MATTPFPLGFQRTTTEPLDSSAVFSSLAALQAYAVDTAGTAYPGQVCAVATATDTDLYMIQPDRTVSNVGLSAHSHPISEVTNLQLALDGKANIVHTHSIADVTALQTTLDGKAASVHSHAIADVTNLQSSLNGKANTAHTHAIADVTSLQTSLNGKANTTHTHVIADVTDLQTALNGKQNVGTYATLVGGTVPLTQLPGFRFNVGPSFVYRFGGTGSGQNFENSGFVGPSNVTLGNSVANNSPVGGFGFYGGWDDLEFTRSWFNPSLLFPLSNRFRIIAVTKCASVFNDGVWTMIRSLSATGVQTTIPGLAAYGGASAGNSSQPTSGLYVGISNDLITADWNSYQTFIAYFAAYNGGNGGSVSMVQVFLQGFNV